MTRNRGDETRERILSAAEECFNELGYEGAGLAEICGRAGVSRGAFYHHFPSKQAVFLVLLERWLVGVEEGLAAARASAATVPEQLTAMADVVEAVFAAGRGRLPLFLEFWTQAAHDPAVWEATIAPYRRYRDLFAGLICSGMDEGSLRAMDPTVAAQLLLALGLGLVLQGLLDPDGADWSNAVREGVAILLNGMQRPLL